MKRSREMKRGGITGRRAVPKRRRKNEDVPAKPKEKHELMHKKVTGLALRFENFWLDVFLENIR